MGSVSNSTLQPGWNSVFKTENMGYTGFTGVVKGDDFVVALKVPRPGGPETDANDYFIYWPLIEGNTLGDHKIVLLEKADTCRQISNMVAIGNRVFLSMVSKDVGGTVIASYSVPSLNFVTQTPKLYPDSPFIDSGYFWLFAAQNQLYATVTGQRFAQVYDADLTPLHQIDFGTGPSYTLSNTSTDDRVIFASNTTRLAYDSAGKLIAQAENKYKTTPFLGIIDQEHIVAGFYDRFRYCVFFQVCSAKTLEPIGPDYIIDHSFIFTSFNTGPGIIFSGADLLFLGNFPTFQPNATLIQGSYPKVGQSASPLTPTSFISFGDTIQIWQYNDSQEISATETLIRALKEPTPALKQTPSCWEQVQTIPLQFVEPFPGAVVMASDNNNTLLLGTVLNTELSVYRLNDETQKLEFQKSIALHGNLSSTSPFHCGNQFFVSFQGFNGDFINYVLNGDTFEKLEGIEGQMMPIGQGLFGTVTGSIDAPQRCFTVYDAQSKEKIVSFEFDYMGGMAIPRRIGDFYIQIDFNYNLTTYDLTGKKLETVSTGFVNSAQSTLIQLDEKHVGVPIVDDVDGTTTIQIWEISPLKLVQTYELQNSYTLFTKKAEGGLFLGQMGGLNYIEGNYPDFTGMQQLLDFSDKEEEWVSSAVTLNGYEVTKGKDNLILWKKGEKPAAQTSTGICTIA